MKRIFVTTALVLSTAAPALATDTMVSSTMGDHNMAAAEVFRDIALSSDDGLDRINATQQTNSGIERAPASDRSAQIIRQIGASSDEGLDRVHADKVRGTSFDAGPVNERAAAILESLAAADEG